MSHTRSSKLLPIIFPELHVRAVSTTMLPEFLKGALLAVLASVSSSLGTTLQKKCHVQLQHQRQLFESEDSGHEEPEYHSMGTPSLSTRHIDVQPAVASLNSCNNGDEDIGISGDSANYKCSPIWQLGMALIILGSLFDFIALIYASPAVIAPLGALVLCANTVWATTILKEQLTYKHVLLTFIVLVGCFTVVASAPHDQTELSLPMLYSRFWKIQFMIYVLLILAIVYLLWRVSKKFAHMKSEADPHYAEHLHILSLGTLSGVIGGQSVLLAKCFGASIAATTSSHWQLLWHIETYVIVAVLALTAFEQIAILNVGLSQFYALNLVPVFQSSWMIFSVLGGVVFFDEIIPYPLCFMIGIATILIGLFAIASITHNIVNHATHDDSVNVQMSNLPDVGNIDLFISPWMPKYAHAPLNQESMHPLLVQMDFSAASLLSRRQQNFEMKQSLSSNTTNRPLLEHMANYNKC